MIYKNKLILCSIGVVILLSGHALFIFNFPEAWGQVPLFTVIILIASFVVFDIGIGLLIKRQWIGLLVSAIGLCSIAAIFLIPT